MKRSKMLGKLYNYLYNSTDIPEESLEQVTLGILNICESSGMLPPVKKFCPVLLVDSYSWEQEEDEQSEG